MKQEKYFLTSSFLSLLSFLLCPVEAFDYRFSGRVENFSKIGFNNSQINTKKGIYPTESFIDIVTLAQVKVNLLPKGIENHRLSVSLGGAIAAIPYDKTKYYINQANGKVFGSIVENFIGGYHGYFYNKYLGPAYAGTSQSASYHARPYVVDTAFLRYDYKDVFGFKAGRYEANIDFMSGSNQGWEVYYQPYKTETQRLRFWWWSSFGRGLAFNSWIYEFFATVPYLKKGGNPSNSNDFINYGWHGITTTYSYKGLDAQFFYYFAPKTYNAPGFKLVYDTNRNFENVGFRSQSMIMTTFPLYYRGWYNPETNTYSLEDSTPHGSLLGRNGVTLNIRQVFWWDNFNWSIGFYNTFGNSDAFLGSHTMPRGNNTSYISNEISVTTRHAGMIGYDFWDNTAYDGLADAITNANTFTFYTSVGGIHKRFAWHVFGRVSHANKNALGQVGRANEYSLQFNASYAFTESVLLNFRITYYGARINKGYQAGYFGAPKFNDPDGDFSANYQDRSYMMTNLTLKF